MNLSQHGAPLVEEALHDPENLSLANSHEVVAALVDHLDCGLPQEENLKRGHIPNRFYYS